MEYWPLKLPEFASVKAFAGRFEERNDDLDTLVANASVAMFEFSPTSDGYDKA